MWLFNFFFRNPGAPILTARMRLRDSSYKSLEGPYYLYCDVVDYILANYAVEDVIAQAGMIFRATLNWSARRLFRMTKNSGTSRSVVPLYTAKRGQMDLHRRSSRADPIVYTTSWGLKKVLFNELSRRTRRLAWPPSSQNETNRAPQS